MSATLVDGSPTQSVSSADRGLHYGDGLFETITCVDGRARWLTLHFERLRRGCERLQIAFAQFDLLHQEIEQLAAGAQRCIIKVIVTRGVGQRRGYAPGSEGQPTRIVSRHDWPPAPQRAQAGFHVGLSTIKLGINPQLAGLKHLNRLEQVLAQMARVQAGSNNQLDEVLMLSSSEAVIGGSMSNVFFADATGLITPDLSDCGIAGVMRQVVINAASELGIAVSIRPLAVGELAVMQESFVTNVRWGVQSVAVLAGRHLQTNEYAVRLRRLIGAPHD